MKTKNSSTAEETIKLLLISNCQDRVAKLTQQMAVLDVPADIKVMRPGRAAITFAQRAADRKGASVDLVVVDFSDPDRRCQSILTKLAFGADKICTPMVLLTSNYSEELLDHGAIDCDTSIMFSPTPLTSFLGKMRELSREKFLRTVTIVSGVGPILVRLPGHYIRSLDDTPICQVA